MSSSSPPPVEPGVGTTEFWTSLLTTVVSLAVAVAELVGSKFDPTSVQALIPAIATIAAAVTSAVYAHSRSSLKAAAHQASATVAASAATAADAVGDQAGWPDLDQLGVPTRQPQGTR